jgi:sugar (pentulose or hexulose) kinase
MADYLLGIDVGTSVIKTALFDLQGREYATASKETRVLVPALSWSEANMTDVWQTTADTIRQLLHSTSIRGEQIAAVGITGNMVGAWIIDANGNPIRDAILWNDGRCIELISRLEKEQPGFTARIFSSSGSVMQPGCTLPILRWLHENEPHILERASAVLCCKDWIRFNLTGMLVTDPTEASVMPGDTRTRNYSDAMFELLGVGDYRALLPEVAPSQMVVGQVHARAAELTGLHEGTPVVTGAGDVPCSAVGAGAVQPGVACTILGTTCLNCLVTPDPVFTPADVGLLFCMPEQGWLRVMANIAGTTNLDWFIDQFFSHEQQTVCAS